MMVKSQTKKKCLVLSFIVLFVLALCGGLCAILGFGQKGGKTTDAPSDDAVVQRQFTFGQTYTINGKQYTLGEKEDECIDYYTALGLSRKENIVSLTKFTYRDGTDGTDETTSVRNAGTYEFEIQPLAAGAQPYADSLLVDGNKIKIDVNQFGAFINTTAQGWAAHGDINTIYQHNDGWYFVQVGDKATVNTRTVTNSTYSINLSAAKTANADANTEEEKKAKKDAIANITKYIMINGEKKAANGEAIDTTDAKSYYEYAGKWLHITSREGCMQMGSGEYVASFRFELDGNDKNNYQFDYSDESKLSEKYRGLDVPLNNRTNTTFVLKKYWYIVYSDDAIGLDGLKNGGEPYSPFAVTKNGGDIQDYDIEDFTTPVAERKFAIADTITYGNDILVNEPHIIDPTKAATAETAEFAIELEPADGSEKQTVRAMGPFEHHYWWQKGASDEVNEKATGPKNRKEQKWYPSTSFYGNKTVPYTNEKNTIQYYINKSMPAGTYTLTLVYYPKGKDGDRVTGEYKLYVLPRAYDSKESTDLHNKIRGTEKATDQDHGEHYRNSRPLGTATLHDDITVAHNALNGTLLFYEKTSRQGFWASEDLPDKLNELYVDKVTIQYSREGYGGGLDYSEKTMADSFRDTGTFPVYYSISAKNYVTAGGVNSQDFANYGFYVWMFTGIDVKDIYDKMTDTENPTYFQDGTYNNGASVDTVVYASQYYDYVYDDDAEHYQNTGKTYVKLKIKDDYKSTVSWDTTKLPHADEGGDWLTEYYSDYFKFDGSDLLVYYDILPAQNSWSIAPQMPNWNYDSFSQDNNKITGTLRFSVTDKSVIQFRIGRKTESNAYEWLKITTGEDGAKTYSFDATGDYFAVDADNKVSKDIADALNTFEAGTYYIDSKVPAIKNPNAAEGENDPNKLYNVKELQTLAKYSEVTVLQTQNKWDTLPFVIGWAYSGFDASNFQAGVPYYFVTPGEQVEYTLYSGTDTTSGGRSLTVTASQPDDGGQVTYSLSDEDIDHLTGLSAGQYTIVASYKGTTNYADLSLSIFFNVAQAQNSWKQAPYVIGWTYGSFNNSNFQEGEPLHNTDSKKVEYTLFKEEGETSNPQWTTSKTEASDIYDAFRTLGAGQYKLVATLAEATDHAALSQAIFFSVSQAQNRWTQTPRMLGWTYQGFNPSTEGGSFQAGIPFYFNTEGEVVEYKLYEGTATSGTAKYTLNVTKGEAVDAKYDMSSDDKTYFTNLSAGTYTLVASYLGTDDYATLSLNMVFSVSQAQNTWTTTPSIVGWTFGSFSAGLFTAGTAAYNTEGIAYNVYADTATSGTALRTLTVTNVGTEEPKYEMSKNDETYFKELPRGTYTLVASVEGTNNYSALSMPMTFVVSQTQNRWTTAPFITGWSYLSFNAGTNFRAGVAERNTTGKFVKYALYEETGTSSVLQWKDSLLNSDDEIKGKFENLGAGQYKLVASLEGTTDYADLSLDMVFSVSQAQNTWTVTPAVIGWTYGSDPSNLFTEGVSAFPTSGAVVEYTLYKVGTPSDEKLWTQPKTLKKDIIDAFKELGAGAYRLDVKLEGDVNYTGLELSVEFNVAQTQNTWTTAPFITGWAYDGFAADTNFRGGVAERNTAGKEVTYTLYEGTGTSKKAWDASFKALSGTNTLSEEIAANFKALHYGTYTLLAELEGTPDYAALRLEIVFNVTQAQNTWTKTPSIVGWTIGGYSADLFTAGTARFNTAGIVYSVYTGAAVSGNALFNFTAIANAKDNFEALSPGTYTLDAHIDGTADYSVLSMPMVFSVSKAQNRWTTTPTVIGWTYGSYSPSFFTPGEAAFTPSGKKVTYTLYKEEGDKSTTVWTGSIDDADTVKSKLGQLGAGQYKLVAQLVGTDDYSALSLDIFFSVSQAQNTWETTPSVIGWTFGSYDEKLFTEGKASFKSNDENVKVQYSLYKQEGEEYKSKWGPLDDIATVTSNISGLGAGQYKLVATYAGSADYTALSLDIIFSVAQAQNKWTTTPSIVGWTYGGFNIGLFTAGAATFNTDGIEYKLYLVSTSSSEYKYTLTVTKRTGGDNKYEMSEEDVEYLKKLTPGNYTLNAAIAEDTNYSALSLPMTFSVAQAQNSWKSGSAPFITGWAYKNFSAGTNFQNGVPENNPENKDVTYSVYEGNTASGDSLFEFTDINGTIDSTKVIDKFNNLPAKQYTLVADLAGTADYADLTQSIVFSVSKADNSWSTTPVMVGFAYGGFEDKNFRAGTALLDEDEKNKKLTYTLTKGIETADTETAAEPWKLVLEVSVGKFTDETKAALNLLPVDGYTLEIKLEGTENYNDLVGYITFNITQAANGWENIPSISGWTYGDAYNRSADSANLFATGKAKFGDDVLYTVQNIDGDGSVSNNVSGFIELSAGDFLQALCGETVSELKGLDAGSYNLHVEVKETTDYAGVSRDIRFTVSKANNKWDIVPSIKGWTFGNEPNYPTKGVADVDTGNQIQYKYYAAKEEGGSSVDYNSPMDIDDDEDLKGLFAGYYAMVATLQGNDNYNDLVEEAFFRITAQAVQWDEKTVLQRVTWNLSDADTLESSALTKVAVVTASNQPIQNYTLSYAISKVENNIATGVIATASVVVTGEDRDTVNLVNALKALAVGDYSISITAELGAAGSFSLSPMTVSVTVSLAQPDIEFDPSDGGSEGGGDVEWSWGAPDNNKTLNDIQVSDDLAATVTYRIYDGSTWSGEYDNFEKMKADLFAKPAGSYTVEYIVRCDNYATLTRRVNVRILQAKNGCTQEFAKDETEEKNNQKITWTWGEFLSDSLQRPMFTYGDDTVVYTVNKNGSLFKIIRAADQVEKTTRDGSTPAERAFNVLVDDLTNNTKEWTAGTYRIIVSIAETGNYAASSITYDFEISKVTTAWGSVPVSSGTELSKEYDEDYSGLAEPTKSKQYPSWNETAQYTLKVSGATTGSLYSGGSWTDLLAELKKCEEGDYTVSATIAGDVNYTELTYSFIVKIAAKANTWKSGSAPADIVWTYGEKHADLVFEATYNQENLVITYNERNITDSLMETLSALDARDVSYSFTVTFTGNKKYATLEKTISLTIKRANNAWSKGEGSSVINLGLSKLAGNEGYGWTWNNGNVEPNLVLPVPEHGASATVVVTLKETSEEAFRVDISYADGKPNTAEYDALVRRLQGLGVEKEGYKITVSVGVLTNYNALGGQEIEFLVKKATNNWTLAPEFTVNNVVQSGTNLEWVYEDKVSAAYGARHGTVSELYYDTSVSDSTGQRDIPANVGKYKAVFSVADTDNYAGLTQTIFFEIIGKTEKIFDVTPGVSAWTWHNYDRAKNLFAGLPASRGDVRFVVSGNGANIEFQLRDADDHEHEGNFNSELYVPKNIAIQLNELLAGTYTLHVFVEKNGNYAAFDVETTFEVLEAENRWTDTPKIAAWYFGNYKEEVNLPTAESLHGTPVIVVTARDDEEDVYYNSATGKNLLDSAPVGDYTVTVTVAGAPKMYDGLEEVIYFSVFVNTNLNYWVDVPGMDGWIAALDGVVKMPSGRPARGKPYFEFYKAEFKNGSWQRGGVITAVDDAQLINEDRFAYAFYMPTAPGTYFMLAYAENPDDPEDYLGPNNSSRIMFTISEREIEWDQTVRIASVLYLGEKNKWAQPTSRTSLTGDKTETITYRYIDALTRKDLGTQIPTVPGKYIVVASAYARYTQTITCEMMFDVQLSKNAWRDGVMPSIESWSEEFNSDSPNPVGSALYGSVFFMYIDKDHPDIILTEKPTTAGHYIMIARVELDGYETLEARYEFTIEPAYDTTFVLIDIILGLVACAFAVVVIIFAIRRYKEN